ncbi:hypothetical protein DICVIV_09259 [Dictyocaulus viviparus]|uniref:Uncharacterized protein n=1 Tax=Dictyocaulus viviparus TaxID=29172 RepID=A0A0D8XLT9_DICVI|nr:hypothetical protein DICVIV_09259 [Dictyocaulus viviparus]
MNRKSVSLEVPVLRPLHLNLNELVYTPPARSTPICLDHSPNFSQKIKIPKKKYSYADPLQRMDTPIFDKNEISHVKKGPSSPTTVMTMAGLFVVGILLMMSGVIVISAHTETPFIVTGCLFLGVGFAMLLVCAILQRKNIIKFIHDLNSDLYFLKMNKSYMWKVMFENRAELPLSE